MTAHPALLATSLLGQVPGNTLQYPSLRDLIVDHDNATAVGAAHSLVTHLAEEEPDVLVLELGDGLLGSYGVHALLSDVALAGAIRGVVLCAQDPVGAWGARQLLAEKYEAEILRRK